MFNRNTWRKDLSKMFSDEGMEVFTFFNDKRVGGRRRIKIWFMNPYNGIKAGNVIDKFFASHNVEIEKVLYETPHRISVFIYSE